MKNARMLLVALGGGLLLALAGCDTPEEVCAAPECTDAGIQGEVDAGSADAGTPDAGSKAAQCASQFGNQLTASFGRIDGTILAVVGPTDTQCPIPNSNHLVVQVLMHGAAYRIVVNVQSDGRNGTDTRLRYSEAHHALIGVPWAEGWHTGTGLDYPTLLGAHSNSGFSPYPMNELVQKVSDRLVIGARISAFVTSSGGTKSNSAHLVHRNYPPANSDGALVLNPDSADPVYLLFFFDGVTF